MRFYEQLERHYNAQYEGTYIKPHPDWEKEDYVNLHHYIQTGWLLSDFGSYILDSYIINPEWEGEEPWTPPQKKKFKFKVITEKERKARKIRKDIEQLYHKADEQHKAKADKTLKLMEEGVEFKDATIKIYGQTFMNKVDKLLDKIECEDVLRNYFIK